MSQTPESTRSMQHTTNQLLSLPTLNINNDNVQNKSVPPLWRRPGGITLIALILLVLIIGGLFLHQATSKYSVTFQYQAVQQGDIALTVSATGPLQSTGTYNLAAVVNATINEIDVKVGQTVKKDQMLARFDKTSLQDQVDADQATVDGAQATVTSAQSTLNNDNYYGMAQTQILAAQAQLSTAQAQLKGAQVQLNAAQRSLNAATLTAPHSGIVTAINGQVGGTLGGGAVATSGAGSSSGASAGGTFIQIVDLSSLQIQADVNESDMANLQTGNSVQFTVDAYGDQQFTGTVSAISPAGVTSSNVVTYPVTITVNMKSAQSVHLFPNMTASVTITVIQHRNVPLIPVGAINFARQASSGISTAGIPQLISAQDAASATRQAQQMLNNLESQNSSLSTQNPIAAFVIENGTKGHYTVKPVVLGVTDGTSYEVLSSTPHPGENIIAGVGNSSGDNSAPSSSSGGSVKGS